MNNDTLRPVQFSTSQNDTGYFHQWVTKVFDDENYKCEHVYALVEKKDGTMKEVHAEAIKFLDR